jgi:hypothetical protein
MSKRFKNAGAQKSLIDVGQKAKIVHADEVNIEGHIVFSYRYFKETFEKLEEMDLSLIKKVLTTIINYSEIDIHRFQLRTNLKLNHYGPYPSKATVPIPDGVPCDGVWYAIRFGIQRRMIGFLAKDSNVFFVVFIDNDHDWYK